MRIVVALPAPLEDPLLPVLLVARHEIVARPGAAPELASVIDSLRPDAALVHGSSRLLGASVVEAADRVGVRLVVLATTPAERALAASLGIHEVLAADADHDEVVRLLEGQTSPVPVTVPDRARAQIVAVWGPAGAPGRSTTALNIATELAQSGLRTALVDADPYGGAIAPLLGLLDEAPGFAAACRLAASGGLDIAQLDRIVVPIPLRDGQLSVFTGLSRPAGWTELTRERVAATLDALRDWAEVVVVDTGFSLEADEEIMSDVLAPRRNAATLAALAEADRVVVVGSADAVSLARLIRGYAEITEIMDPAKLDVLLNRVRRSAVGFDARTQVTAALQRFAGVDAAAIVPWDAAYDQALAAAQPLALAAPKSAARAALAAYVRERLLPAVGSAGAAARADTGRNARRMRDRVLVRG